MSPHAIPVSKLAPNPATHTAARLLCVNDVRTNARASGSFEPEATRGASPSAPPRLRHPAEPRAAAPPPPRPRARPPPSSESFPASSSSLASSTNSTNSPPSLLISRMRIPSPSPSPPLSRRRHSDSLSAETVSANPTSMSASCAWNGAVVYPEHRQLPTHAGTQSSGPSHASLFATHCGDRGLEPAGGRPSVHSSVHAHRTADRSTAP